MKLAMFVFIACAFLVVAGCIVEPWGGGGHGDYYRGDYGHRVWHE